MRKFITFAVLAFLVLPFLSGCAGLVRSDVTAFHQIDANNISGAKYAFLPLENQANNLEYLTYCDLIEKEVQKYGAIRTTLEDAEYLIAFGYGIDDGKEQLASMPVWGQTGVSSSHTTANVTSFGNTASGSANTTYTPTYGVVGSQTYSRTSYTRLLHLNIYAKSQIGQVENRPLYQSEVKSQGSSSQLSQVMPSLIYALFKDFPGESGKPRRVTTPKK